MAIAKRGEPLRWLQEHSTHEGNECLFWPFGGNGNGYGRAAYKGRPDYAHRVMCELAHGKAPAQGWQAAHSCGNRNCVNPKHIRWASQSENEIDKAKHGKDLRGEKHFNAKLSVADVQAIRALERRLTHKEIATRFGIGSVHVHRICRRQRWGWLA